MSYSEYKIVKVDYLRFPDYGEWAEIETHHQDVGNAEFQGRLNYGKVAQFDA